VMFYIAVPLIVWLCRKLNRDAVLVALFCASVAYRLLVKEAHAAVQLPGVLSFFLAGALVHYHHAAFMRYGKYLMLVAAVLLGLHEWTHWFFLRPVSIPFLVLGAALLLPVVKGPTRWGDFSYGTYVLHWPVLQLVIATGLFAIHPWLAVLVSLVLVAIGAVISWFAVENPALAYAHRRKKRRDAKRSMAHA
jgi:peptidoglycan/LPS O-acetylase OafA/YrhL